MVMNSSKRQTKKSIVQAIPLVYFLIALFLITGCQQPHKLNTEASQMEHFEIYPIGMVQKKNNRTFIVIDKQYEPGLKGLDKHNHVTVVYWFDKNDTPKKRAIMQVHPRGDMENPLTGVFATHSPFRPNLIAITKCDIISVEENVIEIKQIDAFDGSPVLDLKGDFFRFN